MPSYSVTTIPQNIQNPLSADTTLLNNGPATVYIGNDSSVTSTSGYPLKPTASLAWPAGSSLWVVTGSGTATLVSGASGSVMNTSNIIAQNTIYNSGAQTSVNDYATPALECGSYQSLIVTITGYTSNATNADANYVGLQFQWLDGNGNVIVTRYLTEYMRDNPMLTGATTRGPAVATIPVEGQQVIVTLQGPNLSTFGNLMVVGDNRQRTPTFTHPAYPLALDAASSPGISFNTYLAGYNSIAFSHSGTGTDTIYNYGATSESFAIIIAPGTTPMSYTITVRQVMMQLGNANLTNAYVRRSGTIASGVTTAVTEIFQTDPGSCYQIEISFSSGDALAYTLVSGGALPFQLSGPGLITDNNFETGSFTAAMGGAASKTGSVTFPTQFATAPTVMLTIATAAGNKLIAAIDSGAGGVTATGFAWAVKTGDGTTSSASPTVSWLAFIPS